MTGRFAGRRAVVTGASRVIGAAVAEQLAAEESMVAGVLALCDGPPELTGGVHVSLDLLAQQAAGR